MKVKIGNRLIYFRSQVFNLKKETRIGINSGQPFDGSHFLFLDYDSKDFDVHSMCEAIMKANRIKKGMIMNSGNGYHFVSFTPMKFGRMLEIISKSGCCESYRKCVMKNGYSTLRVTPKGRVKIKFLYHIVNPEGNNYYDYDREQAYLKMVEGDL